MTTQIHKFHTRDTEEQLYDVPLHDVELNDVANVRHKSASSCVPSWLRLNLVCGHFHAMEWQMKGLSDPFD